MHKQFKIVFMGTPDFAVPTLEAIHQSRHELALVVTQPDRPKGRGRKMLPPPVKKTALELGYDVIQPQKVRNPEFVDQIKSIAPDLFVVVAFGHILHEPLLNLPRLGAINIHASLLPKYRGSAPIQWAIINGEKQTGVTTMFMDKGLDTGDILLRDTVDILKQDTSATLHDRLAQVGADVLMKTLEKLETSDIQAVPQNNKQATYAPMLKKSNGFIDWQKPAASLECLIRGVTPWPGAFTFWGQRRLKIFRAEALNIVADAPPGTVVEGFPGELRIATGKGVLSILEIQGASGKRLKIADFLRGCNILPGTSLNEEPEPDCVL